MLVATRGLLFVAVLLATWSTTGAARADGVWPSRSTKFLSLSGGGLLPLAGSAWRDYAETSPTLSLRAGTGIAGSRASLLLEGHLDLAMLSTPTGEAPLRIRALVGPRFESPVDAPLIKTVHAGLGVDLLDSDAGTSAGFALELGGGLWLPVGPVLLSIEAALPISVRGASDDRPSGRGSVDLTLLGGVMFRSVTGGDD